MHIGFVTTEYPTSQTPEGGLGNYIRKTAIELVKCGNTVTVFWLGKDHPDLVDEGVNVRHVKRFKVPWRLKKNKGISNWLEIFERLMNSLRLHRYVINYHRRMNLDIVQVPNYQYPGYFLCNNGYFPVICRCSSYSPLLRAANGITSKLKDAASDWLEVQQVRKADVSFAPSHFIADIYNRFESVSVRVVPTPIENPQKISFDYSVAQKFGDRKYLLYFGTLNGIKGVDILIQALPDILKKHPDISMVFVGPNHKIPSGELALNFINRVLAQYVDEGRIIYSPALEKSKLYPIINNALGVVIPSRVDNYPNTCLEAFSLGVPVIGTKGSSLEEIIDDGKTGFLAENSNIESLTQVIQHFLSLPADDMNDLRRNVLNKRSELLNENRVELLVREYVRCIQNFERHK